MPPDTLRLRSLDPWGRLAVVVWAAVVLVIGVRCAVKPHSRTLYPTWATAGADWLAGSDRLYRRTGEQNNLLDTFRYTPFVAATLVPWHFLPDRAGGVLWRLFNAGVFLGGAWWWLRAAAPVVISERRKAIFFLLLVPLSLSSLNNGQVNPLVIGFLLAALAAAAGERWWLAAAFVALAASLKLYPLAVGLLLAACYPRQFYARLLVALAAVALLPFALQRPEYVLEQYRQWLSLLKGDDRKDWPLHMTYRDLWLLFRVWGVPITPAAYQLFQALGGVACAVVCVVGRWRGQSARQVLTSVLTLGSCWMILLGPATEAASFILLAPALAWALVAEPPGVAKVLAVAGAGLLLACVLAGLFPGTSGFHARGFHPLGALLFTGAALMTALRRAEPPAAGRATEENVPLAA